MGNHVRSVLFRSAILAVLIFVAACAMGCPGSEVRFEFVARDKALRSFRVFVPEGLDRGVPAPLVLALHGGGGTALEMERYTRFDAVAQREGFIVAYPNGYRLHWNDGRDDVGHATARKNVDDVGFIHRLIDRVAQIAAIDRSRVYVVGMSNGGMMAHRLALELPDVFAAAAAVAANIPEPLLASTLPPRPVPMLLINGVDDPIIPWEGADGAVVLGKSIGSVASADRTAAFWTDRNACTAQGAREWFPDADPRDGARAWRQQWSGAGPASDVVLCGIEGGGHTWPGSDRYLPERFIGTTCMDIDATEVIWQFFSRHRRGSAAAE